MKARIIRLRRRSATLAAGLLLAGALAGNAAGAGPSVWEEAWAQIKPLLQQPGTINQTDNPVHWTKLKGVPAAFADGTDNGVDKAGFGLRKDLFPSLAFAVDTTKIQQRIVGACPTGQGIQSVAANGAVTCAPGVPAVYFGWDKPSGPVDEISDNWARVGGGMDVPAGSWSIVAKLNANGIAGAELDWLYCHLDVSVDENASNRDWVIVGLDSPSQGGARVPIVLTGVYSSAKPFRVALLCKDSWDGTGDNDSEAGWEDIKITATQVNLHTQQLN